MAQAAWYWPFTANKGLAYTITFSGINDETRTWFKQSNLNERNTATPPQTQSELEQESAALSVKIRQALEAKGYYDATIQPQVDKAPPALHFAITPGAQYTIQSINWEWQEEKQVKPVSTSLVNTRPGMPVDAAVIGNDAEAIARYVAEGSCLLSLRVEPLLTLYGSSHKAALTFRIKRGPAANFGATQVSGTEQVKNKVILREVNWQQGECFNSGKLEQTRNALISNQLFSSVQVQAGKSPNAQGQVPVTITVKERAARTIKTGVNYSTDEGLALTGGWEHRNLWGEAETFAAEGTLSQQRQALNGSLHLPDFKRRNQTLALTVGANHEDRSAYQATSLNTGATLERKLSRHFNGGAGVAYTLTNTRDALSESDYGLLSFPAFITYDTRDNVLDSRHGLFSTLNATPYNETFGEGGQFLKTQLSTHGYLSSNMALSPTLALRASAGTITGAAGRAIPSDVRFYAGGGGSVRGYGYQTLGPRVSNSPVGGNSFVAGSAETRLRFNDDFGGVIFTDAGNVYAEEWPSNFGKLYASAGVGVRYYTMLGPLRADIALPLNGRDIGAPAYAVYVSIGQAF